MNANIEREILGEWADKGYRLKEYDDHVVTVVYKDKEIAAFSQSGATPEELRAVCQRHDARLQEPTGCKDYVDKSVDWLPVRCKVTSAKEV